MSGYLCPAEFGGALLNLLLETRFFQTKPKTNRPVETSSAEQPRIGKVENPARGESPRRTLQRCTSNQRI